MGHAVAVIIENLLRDAIHCYMLMQSRKLWLPNQPQYQPLSEKSSFQNSCEFVVNIKERLEQAHKALKQQWLKIKQDDQEKPILFAPDDLVWLQNRK